MNVPIDPLKFQNPIIIPEEGAGQKESLGPVKLNHPHCAKFCGLGGASCSA